MTNIVNLSNHRAIKNAQPRTDIFFPVEQYPLEVLTTAGKSVCDPTRKVLIRPDTGEILGVHKKSYRLIHNSEIFPVFEEALRHTSIDISGMKIKDQLSHGGARSLRSYIFPAHTVNINPQRGDQVSMELKVINSYDGSSAFRSIVGGNRLVCTNGMVAFSNFMQSYGKHTQHLNVARIVMQVNKALEIYMAQSQLWFGWLNARTNEDQVRAVFQAMPGHNEKLEEKLWLLYQDERQDNGDTVWSLYNAMTYWSTHADVRTSSEGNVASIQLEREQRVRSAMQSTAFRAIAA
jgi:hypothetical protein